MSLSRELQQQLDSGDSGRYFEGYPERARALEVEIVIKHLQIQNMLSTLDRLARLGNGDKRGNSEGNQIAIEAIAKYHKSEEGRKDARNRTPL